MPKPLVATLGPGRTGRSAEVDIESPLFARPDGGRERWRRAVALAGMLLGTSCAPVISTIHARAVRDHLVGVSSRAQRMADDAGRHPKCLEGQDPVAVRAQELSTLLGAQADQADDYADGRWPSKDAFREAMAEISSLQSRLSVLRAEYDACRGASQVSTAPQGARGAPGARRFAVLEVSDPAVIVDTGTRETLTQHLRRRLASALPMISEAAVDKAQLDFSSDRSCPTACALAVAEEVGAHKTVGVRLEREGERCAVILEVVDFSTGVVERARTVRQGCGEGSLLTGLEDALQPLVSSRSR